MTKKEYVKFCEQLEGAWHTYQDMFKPNNSIKGEPIFEETRECWLKITTAVEEYREKNCDFKCWQEMDEEEIMDALKSK